MNDEDRLNSMRKDVEANLIPTQKNFFRHFLINEKDWLKLIHLAAKSLKQKQPNIDTTNSDAEQQARQPDVEQEPTEPETEQQSTGAGISASYNNELEQETMTTEESSKLSKKISKIIKNNNLSPETKTELIHDLIIQTQKKKILTIERDKLPSRNSMLLTGAGNNESADRNNDRTNDKGNDKDNDRSRQQQLQQEQQC